MARPRITATDRLQRLLAILQWAAQHPEGIEVEELCERFHLGKAELVRELDFAMMVGSDSPHYDDMPFEVFVEDGLAFVRLFAFRRPLRLTPAEGLALVAAAGGLVGEGDDPPGPLERALEKLGDLLQITPGEALEIEVDPDGGPVGGLLREAIGADRQVRFSYWTYGRDVVATRTVDPWALVSQDGTWYLDGWAHDARAERRFRLDRVHRAEVLEQARSVAARPDRAPELTAARVPEVVLDLAPTAFWVIEAHPTLHNEPTTDGWQRVTLAVSGPSWLERLLLRLGEEARVVAIDEEIGDPQILASAAGRVLARYRRGSTPGGALGSLG